MKPSNSTAAIIFRVDAFRIQPPNQPYRGGRHAPITLVGFRNLVFYARPVWPPSIRFDPASEPDTKQTLVRMDRFLTLLETYQKQMEDPRISLKETSTIVSQMEQQTQELLPLLDTLPEGSGLKDLFNRLLVTSSVETIKFNRGDYLPR